MQTDLIRQGYDRLAPRYLQYRVGLHSDTYIRQLLKYVPKHSLILDVGCGVGVPVDDKLIAAGHQVIGIDNSPEQVALAQRNCPEGEYSVADIQSLKRDQYHVQAVVSLYALFHIPRTQHLKALRTLASYLPKGGMLLITMGDRAFEGSHPLMGVPLWSSQYGTVQNTKLIEQAGFRVILDEIDSSGGERHQVILAEKV